MTDLRQERSGGPPADDGRPNTAPGFGRPLPTQLPLADERGFREKEPKSAMGIIAGVITVGIATAVGLFIATRGGGDEKPRPAATDGGTGSATATEVAPPPGGTPAGATPTTPSTPSTPRPPQTAPKVTSPPAPPADRPATSPKEPRSQRPAPAPGSGPRGKRPAGKPEDPSGPVTHPDGPVTRPDSGGPVTSPGGAKPPEPPPEDKKPAPPPKPVEPATPPPQPTDKLPDKPSEGTP